MGTNEQEPEFWIILKTTPKTKEELWFDNWFKAIAEYRAELYSREILERHFEIKNENR